MLDSSACWACCVLVGLSWESLLTSNSFCICNKVEYCCKSLSKFDCFQGKADALVESQVASPWLKRVTETLTTKTHTHTHTVQKEEGVKKMGRMERRKNCLASKMDTFAERESFWVLVKPLYAGPPCPCPGLLLAMPLCVYSVSVCVCVYSVCVLPWLMPSLREISS